MPVNNLNAIAAAPTSELRVALAAVKPSAGTNDLSGRQAAAIESELESREHSTATLIGKQVRTIEELLALPAGTIIEDGESRLIRGSSIHVKGEVTIIDISYGNPVVTPASDIPEGTVFPVIYTVVLDPRAR